MAEKKVTEKQVKAKVKAIVELFEKHTALYSLCPMTFGYGASGHPDRIVLVNGKFIGVEVKRDANNAHTRPELKAKPNEVAQAKMGNKIVNAGGIWVCIHKDNLEDLFNLLVEESGVALNPADYSKLVGI